MSRASGENVGSYAISQGTLSAGSNYSISFTGANLVIDPKAVTVTLTRDGAGYSASADGVSAFTYSYAGRNGTVYGPSADAPAASGDYTVTVTVADSNYSGSASEDFTVTAVDHPPFNVIDIAMEGTRCTMVWESLEGATYTIEASSDPTDPQSWSAIGGSVASQGGRTTITIDIATTPHAEANRLFMRIKAN